MRDERDTSAVVPFVGEEGWASGQQIWVPVDRDGKPTSATIYTPNGSDSQARYEYDDEAGVYRFAEALRYPESLDDLDFIEKFEVATEVRAQRIRAQRDDRHDDGGSA